MDQLRSVFLDMDGCASGMNRMCGKEKGTYVGVARTVCEG